jgi:hypothetical protein
MDYFFEIAQIKTNQGKFVFCGMVRGGCRRKLENDNKKKLLLHFS